MTGSDLERRPGPGGAATPSAGAPVPRLEPPPTPARPAPERPSLPERGTAPVLVKLPPPFAVRFSQLCWILSLAVGAAAIVYLFVIRRSQLPEIEEVVRSVDATRAEATYETAADIVYWVIFAACVTVVLLQLALLVAFSNRRPRVRWWLLGSILLQAVVLVFAVQLVAVGERGRPLELLLLAQLGLAAAGLLSGLLSPAMRWTARRHDVRRGAPA